jgi:hypothetical protein
MEIDDFRLWGRASGLLECHCLVGWYEIMRDGRSRDARDNGVGDMLFPTDNGDFYLSMRHPGFGQHLGNARTTVWIPRIQDW